jgi:hypothetical protein
MKLEYKKLKVGQKVKMVNDKYLQNGYSKGDIVSITLLQNNYVYIAKSGLSQIGVLVTDIVSPILSKRDLEEKISELEIETSNYKDMIDWMEETGSESYDETEVKVWKTLKTINSKSSDIEKAKIIAKLING